MIRDGFAQTRPHYHPYETAAREREFRLLHFLNPPPLNPPQPSLQRLRRFQQRFHFTEQGTLCRLDERLITPHKISYSMTSEDLTYPPSPGHSDDNNQENKVQPSDFEPSESNPQPDSIQLKEDIINDEKLGVAEGDTGKEDGEYVQEMELDEDSVQEPILQESVNIIETTTLVEKATDVIFGSNSESSCKAGQEDSTIISHQITGSPISGVKRSRMTYVGQEPSVHVAYNFLTRSGGTKASKRKLEELLQQWSEWHTQHSLSTNDFEKALECGEETFYPATHVGGNKTSTFSFWMDNQTSKQTNKFVALDEASVPLYDRGYAMGLTSDCSANLDGAMVTPAAPRCFNCSSYSHSMRECPKPRNHAAISNACKEHSSKRSRNAGARNPARYYEDSKDSNGGKYDGLRPGILDSETRQLMGLGELDPPPWLHRMRQIGYPLGYLEPEDDDRPSGITIYGDEQAVEEQNSGEDGEILQKDIPEPKKKRIIEFPGINAPIPENADPSRWASSPESASGSRFRYHHSSPSSSDHHSDHRRSRGYRGDGPPGCSPRADLSGTAYTQRYVAYEHDYAGESQSPRLNPIARSPSLARSLSDRGRRSPLVHEGSPSQSPYNSLPPVSPNIQQSPQDYGYPSFETWNYNYGRYQNPNPDYSSHRKDRHEHHQHHRRR